LIKAGERMALHLAERERGAGTSNQINEERSNRKIHLLTSSFAAKADVSINKSDNV
jgi:hypothetical protein